MTNNNLFKSDDTNTSGSNFYYLNDKYQLVECIDRQKGFMLLKNLIPHTMEDYYTVAVELPDKRPVLPDNHKWTNHFNADKLMAFLLNTSFCDKANILNVPFYDKATKDWMNEQENEEI